MMSQRERFLAAVAGAPVDRPPCTAWLHFATDALPGDVFAARHAEWFRRFDWDICKIVNDYRYPLPEGIETIDGPADLERFDRVTAAHPAFQEQPKAIKALRAALGPEVPIMDTGFDPFQQIMRKAGYDRAKVIFANKRESLRALDAVCETMGEYSRALKAAGCDAVFFSVNGAIKPPNARGVDEETYRTFMRPFDIRMLEAMKGMTRVLHVHGTELDVKRVLDYPCEAISVSDRLPGNPSLRELRAMTPKCLMGGINEAAVFERALPVLRAEVKDAVAQNGSMRNLILSPGCTIPAQTPTFVLKAFREAVVALGKA